MHYDELQYTIPSRSATEAAARALQVLDDIAHCEPGAVAHFLQHSNVLVLAGLRATGPYVEFSPLVTPTRRRAVEGVLARYGLHLVAERTRYDPPAESQTYSLFSELALRDVPLRYPAIADSWAVPLSFSVAGVTEWCHVIEWRLARLMDKKDLPQQWLTDWRAPHHLRFGMLLGYPGRAISSNLWSEAWFMADGREEPMSTVIIGDPESYGASVGFYVAETAERTTEVQSLIRLWNAVLAQVAARYADLLTQPPAALKRELQAIAALDAGYTDDAVA